MSDRANTITVVLEKTTRVDDLEGIINSIRHIKGVVSAEANVVDIAEFGAREQARHELGQKILKVLYPAEKP